MFPEKIGMFKFKRQVSQSMTLFGNKFTANVNGSDVVIMGGVGPRANRTSEDMCPKGNATWQGSFMQLPVKERQ